MKTSAGRALKKAFKQDALFDKIETQKAKISLLMNSARLDIFMHLCKYPCDHLRGIARARNLSAPTISWHLQKLVHTRYVETGKCGRKNVFWVTSMIHPDDAGRFSVVNDKGMKQVLSQAIQSDSGIREREIVKALKEDQQLVNIRLKKLVNLDLLARDGKGVKTLYYPSPRIDKMKNRYSVRVNHLSSALVSTFNADGLMPKTIRRRGSKLTVEVKLPEGSRQLMIECNPMVTVMRRIK